MEDVQSEQLSAYVDLGNRPVPNAADESLKARLKQNLQPYLFVSAFLFLFSLFELYRWYAELPPMPALLIFLLLGSIGAIGFQLFRYRQEFVFLYRGRIGETPVKNILTKYANEYEASVYSDVILNDEDVTHVVVHSKGITLLEVLDWQTPEQSEAFIEYSAKEILLNGYRPDDNPIIRMNDTVRWLENKMYETLNRSVKVEALLVFPGWFVREPGEEVRVKVVNPRAVLSQLPAETNQGTENEYCLMNYQVTKLIKGKL